MLRWVGWILMPGGALSVVRKWKVINFVDGLKRKLGKIDVFGKLCVVGKSCVVSKLSAVGKPCAVDMFGTFDIPWKKTYIPEWLQGRDLFPSTRTIRRRKSKRKTKSK